jgi:hypothetical protein
MRYTYSQNTTFAMKLRITIFLLLLATVGWSQAVLPVTRTTWNSTPTGWTDFGTSSYTTVFACSTTNGGQMNAPGASDDYYQVFFTGTPDQLSFVAKATATPTGCILLVEQSATGGAGTWTTVANLNALATTCVSYGPYTLTSTTRYVRWTYTRPINVNLTIDDVSITAPTPIVTLTPATLSGFTYTGAGPSAQQSFTASGSSLSGDIVLTAPSGYEISLTSGSGFTGTINLTPSSGTVSATTIYVRLKAGLSIGTYNQTLTGTSGAVTQNVALNGTVTGSSVSDVVAVTGSEAATVSSAINHNAPLTVAQGVQVWQFKVRDGGATLNDADSSPTILTAFTLAQSAGNAVSNWTDAINTVALFDGSTWIATGTVTATTIVFSGLSVSVADNTEKILSLRLSLKCATWATTKDGQDFGFSLSNTNTTFSALGSGKFAFPAIISTNGLNAVAVVATNLAFTVQPISTGMNGAMNPAVQVKATDACGNTDIGYVGNISITSTGTMSPTTNVSNASSGIAVFSTITHTATGTGFTLTASAPGLANATSTAFNITNTTALQPGDIAILAFNNSISTGSQDEISFMTFVDILPGTIIDITDNPYRKCGSPNGWGISEGWIRLLKTSTTLPKGTVVTVRVNGGTPTVFSGDAANWTASKPQPAGQGNFDLNSNGEQIFFMSGGSVGGPGATTATVDTGTYSGYFIFGFNTKGNVWTPICGDSAAGGTQNSGKPDFFDCFLTWPVAQADKNKYIGPVTAANKRDWIERINNPSNWRGYTANAGVGGYDDGAEPNFYGATYTINAGGFTDGLWIGNKSTNWFDCLNWQGLKVPDENVNVILDGNSTQQTNIDATATYASLYSGIAKCKDLTISNQRVDIIASSSNVLKSYGDIYINSGGILRMDDSNSGTADGVLSFNGNWVNSSGINAFQEGNGTVILTGNGTQTISSVAPEATETFYNLTLDNSYTTATSGNIIATNNLDVLVDRTLTISSNTYAEADMNVTVGGNLIINNSGTLYQSNDAGVNTGNISMYRDAFINSVDYIYWSSPLDTFNVNNIISGMPSGYIFKWNPVLNNPNGGLGFWESAAGNTMTLGRGYIGRGPSTIGYPAKTTVTGLFNGGKPNTGVIQPTIERGAMTAATLGSYTSANGVPFTVKDDNYNLVGNPYPSAISANAFLTYNTTTNNVIEGSVRIWTHGTMPVATTNPFYNSYMYNYTTNDYIVYNGTATLSGPIGFNGYIGAGQGFFVVMNEANAGTAPLVFNNSMRVKGSGNNGQFYRMADAASETGDADKSRIWMDLIAPSGNVTRTVVGYVPDATLEKDQMYDAWTLGRDQQEFYSLINDEMMCIQGRPIPFDSEDLVPMGMRIPAAGTYNIAIAAIDGLFENEEQTIYLQDKQLGIYHDLRTAPYAFTANPGTYNDRFILRYTNGTLGTKDFQNSNSVIVASGKEDIKVRSYANKISAIQVYDVLGREIYSKDVINNNEFSIKGLIANHQTLVVKIKLENGQTAIRKTIY